jgi:hypothetical protein
MTSKVALLQFVSGLSRKASKKPTVPFDGHHNMMHNWTHTHCSLKSEISPIALKGRVQATKPRFAYINMEITANCCANATLTPPTGRDLYYAAVMPPCGLRSNWLHYACSHIVQAKQKNRQHLFASRRILAYTIYVLERPRAIKITKAN